MITGKTQRFTVPILSVAGLAMVTSLAMAQPVVVIAPRSPPPPPLTETIPPPPGSAVENFSWRPGHWSWVNGNWAWTQGSYVVAQAPGAVWDPGYWHQDPGGAYVWVEGHWR